MLRTMPRHITDMSIRSSQETRALQAARVYAFFTRPLPARPGRPALTHGGGSDAHRASKPAMRASTPPGACSMCSCSSQHGAARSQCPQRSVCAPGQRWASTVASSTHRVALLMPRVFVCGHSATQPAKLGRPAQPAHRRACQRRSLLSHPCWSSSLIGAGGRWGCGARRKANQLAPQSRQPSHARAHHITGRLRCNVMYTYAHSSRRVALIVACAPPPL